MSNLVVMNNDLDCFGGQLFDFIQVQQLGKQKFPGSVLISVSMNAMFAFY